MKANPAVILRDGTVLDLMSDFSALSIEDVAWNLSGIPRFSGVFENALSVAQHSVLVASLCPAPLKVQGLMHDSHEAFTSDIPSPVKELFNIMCPGAWDKLERYLDRKIYARFNIDLPNNLEYALVKKADLVVRAAEIASCACTKAVPEYYTRGETPTQMRIKRVLSRSESFELFMEEAHAAGIR